MSVESGLSLPTPAGATTPYIYDGGTLCPDGSGAHCCPNGMGMTGAHLGRNVFKCATIGGGLADYYNAEQHARLQSRMGHAGLWQRGSQLPLVQPGVRGREGGNSRCARPLPNTAQKAAGMTSGVSAEYVDPGSQDG
jgi:hypothetical protein